MNFEKPNQPYKSEKIFIKAKPKGLKEKIKHNAQKIVLTGALGAGAIAGGVGYVNNDRYPDYTNAGSFNEAFNKARRDKKSGFRWKGKYFTTELAGKELSDSYFESKKFLEDYYSFKFKGNDKEVKKIIDKLKEPSYVSITSQKGDRDSDGSYEPSTNKLFIYGRDNKDNEAIAVHELDHKITSIRGVMKYDNRFDDMLYNSIQELKNSVEFVDFTNKWGAYNRNIPGSPPDAEGVILYLSEKGEIHSRQMSTRFWLSKHFPNYKVDTTFSEEHYNFLKESYAGLPFQMRQLMDIFHKKEDFIFLMQNY